jgi:aspartate/methionine/tyrosine aminotransferase
MNEFQPFEMERWMSEFEQEVEYNLSESGVHPLQLRELLVDNLDMVESLLDTELNYPHANGIPELRENIASLYDGAGPDNVLVTTGAIEANYNTIRTLLSPGDAIAVMLPNYMQIWGLAKNHGLDVGTFRLREDTGWSLDVDDLNETVTDKTKLIAVCNPNNPTGHVLTEKEMEAVVAAADRAGAWILADEVYAGAERETDEQTPSFYGRYDKVIATGSTSKAYGLPGLRIGWVVGTVETVDDIWARHEYTTIAATMLSNQLAAVALSPAVRPRIIQRTRHYVREGFPVLQEWLDRHPGVFELTPPQSGAIAFIRYHLDINSAVLIECLRRDKGVLIVPGDHFGMDRFVRISFGLPLDYLNAGLERMHELVTELKG